MADDNDRVARALADDPSFGSLSPGVTDWPTLGNLGKTPSARSSQPIGYYIDPRNWGNALSALMDNEYQKRMAWREQFLQNPMGHILNDLTFGFNLLGPRGGPGLRQMQFPTRPPMSPQQEEAMRVIHQEMNAMGSRIKTVNDFWGNYLKK